MTTIPHPVFNHPEPKHLARARRTAADFRTRADLEDLLTMRTGQPQQFDALPARLKIAAGLYHDDRARHALIQAEQPNHGREA